MDHGMKAAELFLGGYNCAHLDEPMLALFDEALTRFPAMAAAMDAHLAHNAPLGELFETTFNG